MQLLKLIHIFVLVNVLVKFAFYAWKIYIKYRGFTTEIITVRVNKIKLNKCAKIPNAC